METSSVLLLCILVTCSVWMVQGRSFSIRIDDKEQVEVSGEAQFPGICWGCKWALKKVKKIIGSNSTAESVMMKLKAACDELGLLKAKCHKFVNSHLGVLVEELTTSDDVKTICVNTGACRSKEDLDLNFDPNKEEMLGLFEIKDLLWRLQ